MAGGAAPAPIATDAVVVGTGPVGLFQIFELGLLGLSVHAVDALPVPGGQCVALYPDKPIYDIPGTPVCSGRELVARLSRQIEPFGAGLHLGQAVSVVAPTAAGRFDVRTTDGTAFDAGAVVIAGGIGAFEPRRLRVDGLAAFEGTQVFHHLPDDAATRFDGERVLVVGDGDSALDAALALADAARVTLMHRRDEWKADAATVARVAAARAAGRIGFVAAQPTGLAVDAAGRLAGLDATTPDDGVERLPVDILLVLAGLSPKLGPIADWGLALERRQLAVDTARFETSTRGIFAVGDVNTYLGKRKLIVCGFHEATLAAYAVAEHLAGGTPLPLEYTTTSTRLQRRLGLPARS